MAQRWRIEWSNGRDDTNMPPMTAEQAGLAGALAAGSELAEQAGKPFHNRQFDGEALEKIHSGDQRQSLGSWAAGLCRQPA